MNKKMMLLALVAASTALFALPVAASAQEAHIEGITSFSGTFGKSTLAAAGEPTITCENTGNAALSNHVTGTVNAGGTTGNIELDFTHCHVVVLGLTSECHTAGAPLNNTIVSSGVFHVITVNNKPGILVTPVATTIVCPAISSPVVFGNVIGTITSPACGVESKSITVAFSATGATQNHQSYTGVNYHLAFFTESSPQTVLSAGLNVTAILNSTPAGKLACT
jgi:hypothetical protein